MFSHFRYWLALPLLIVLACAQAAPSDPPSRVGRLSLLDGDVSMRREDSRQWEDASLNWPLTVGDEIATDSDGLAEIRIGSSALRLGNRTAVAILRLDDERIRVRLDEGSIAIRVRSAEPAAAIEVETRQGVVVPLGPGQFRIDHDDATISLTSYRGDLNFRSDDSDIVVTEGRRAQVYVDEGTSVRWAEPEDDDFAEWVLARDERDDALGTPRHVSPEMTGVEDLYEYGDWRTSDEYGEVWYPREVPSGWAPYRSGRWISVAPWGWTWVDDAPWGFAPFHYGRWVLLGHRWAWVPGRYIARPVYAPALVVWLGLPGVVLSTGPAHVGWFPLAPREIYVPSYRYSSSYVREINIAHVTNVVEITRVDRDRRHARYAYRDHRDAVTLVRGEVLRDSRPVFREARRPDDGRWQLPRVATPIPPFDPVRSLGQDRGERSHEQGIRSDRRASPRDRDDADERRRRERDATRGPAARSSVDAEGKRPMRVEPFATIPRERDERRDERRDREREREQRDAERRERVREFRPQDGLEPLPRPSQTERQPRPDPRQQHEQERREREQQQLRQQQLRQVEARRQAEAMHRQENQQIEQRSRQNLQQRTDELRRQQELRDRTQRQFEQQQRRDAQDRQRFGEQQREHERERREQRQAIGQQRELQREQQRLRQQQSGQERETRRRGGEPGGRHDGEASRERP